MLQTESIVELCAALAAAHAELPDIKKDQWNPHFSSHYADIGAIRSAIRPVLSKHGLFVTQSFTAEKEVVYVTTRIAHKSGQYLEDISRAEARNGAAQSVAAAVTFMSRYALISMLGLSLGEDDDGNATRREDDDGGKGERRNDDEVFHAKDKASQDALIAELKRRNVPDTKWDAIAKWLDGKDKQLLSKAIVSV